MTPTIRPERDRDHFSVRLLNQTAFETPAEANLVDSLRARVDGALSLVAEVDGAVVGHIMFTPVDLDCGSQRLVMGLGPMAVSPEQQRSGVGRALVEEGLAECRRLGAVGVVVLGHPSYYPRFGFQPASGFGLASQYAVPDEVFMALELEAPGFSSCQGIVRYHPLFDEVT